MVVRPFANLGAWTGVEIETIDACGHGRPRLQPEPVHRGRGRCSRPGPPLRAMSVSHKPTATLPLDSQRALIERSCLTCHDDDKEKGGADARGASIAAKADAHAEIAEKMIRKLRAGMMPPPGAERPAEAALDGARGVARSEARRRRRARARIPAAARSSGSIAPSTRARSGPPRARRRRRRVPAARHDQPQLRQHRRRAVAVGRRCSRATCAPRRRSAASRSAIRTATPELDDLQGAAHGVAARARRRRAVRHARRHLGRAQLPGRRRLHVPDDAALDPDRASSTAARARGEQIEVSVNGAARRAHRDQPADERSRIRTGMNLQTPPIAVKAGPQRVSAAFIQRIRRRRWTICSRRSSTRWPTRRSAAALGVTTLPHLRDLAVVGPSRVTGVSDTPSRRRVFTCRPLSADEEARRARRRSSTALATQAYRRPVTADDVDGLMQFYQDGARDRRLRGRHPHGAAGDAREPALHLPARGSAGRRRGRDRPTASATSTSRRGCRSSSGAAVRTTELIDAAARGRARHARRPRAAGAAHARRSARGGARDALRGAVAAAAGSRQDPSRRAALSRTSTTTLADAMRARDGAALRAASSARTATCSSC